VRRAAALRACTTAGDLPPAWRVATFESDLAGLADFRGAFAAERLDAGLAALFAIFFELLVAARADAPLFAPFALFLAVLFADRVTAFFLAALCTTLFDARFAPFAFLALFFDAFDLAIGEPLRPWTAAEDPPATGRRACLDRLS
jgi:hypothetical protein